VVKFCLKEGLFKPTKRSSIMTAYNGWSGHIRTIRGRKFYNDLKASKIVRPKCALCGGTAGLTFHAEEYGSTWEDYIQSTHPVCAYCHGMIHMRFGLPNRWNRLLSRVGAGEDLPFQFKTLYHFFKAAGKLEDCKTEKWIPSGVPWADDLPKIRICADMMKVALIVSSTGVFKPDPKVYSSISKVEGLRYCHKTKQLYEFKHVED